MNKIGLIGRVDPSCLLKDGQTVKTRTIWQMLCSRYGKENIVLVDTLNYKSEPFRVSREYFQCMKECDDIVVLLSNNGRKFFFPLLAMQAKRNNRRIYHNLIGGSLAKDVRRNPQVARQLNSFQVNWLESRSMVSELKSLGVYNCSFLPNFKQITPLKTAELVPLTGGPRKLCMFARMTEKKGVLEAISAVAYLCDRDGADSWSLDLYGPVDPGFRDELEAALAESPFARYCGCVDPNESVGVLRGYWALLFPTKWESEGFPGTIIDSFAAGLPVVASRWAYYSEMLDDGVTGYSYEYGGTAKDLAFAIDLLAKNDYRIMDFKLACLQRFNLYSADNLFEKMINCIEKGRR